MTNTLYDQVAEHYDIADRFQVITETHHLFHEQVQKRLSERYTPLTIVDFGVGDGRLLGSLKSLFPDAKLIGLDTSSGMLQLAEQDYGITTIQTDFRQADQYIAPHSADLIIAHFILAFIDYETLLQVASRVLKPGGLLSIAATTYESFPKGHTLIEKRIQALKFTKALLSYWYHRALNQTHTPKTDEQKIKFIHQAGLKRLDYSVFSKRLHCESINACYDYGFRAGWLPNAINYSWIPPKCVESICKACLKHLLPIPFDDEHIVAVELLETEGTVSTP